MLGFSRPVNRLGHSRTKQNSSNHKPMSFHSCRHFAVFVWKGFGGNESRMNWQGTNEYTAGPGCRQCMCGKAMFLHQAEKEEPLIALCSSHHWGS